ncbi:hypothetical protein HMPREF9413_5505 [Paenibacillus sp. HGF7]|nr:hypothetical protein HMPREF9413_5505 [Paenibacillus sp. HGF7]
MDVMRNKSETGLTLKKDAYVPHINRNCVGRTEGYSNIPDLQASTRKTRAVILYEREAE